VTEPVPQRISRAEHALRHGPTAGDLVRLGDTDLWIRIEEDLTAIGDEPLWGYGKDLRSRMTQRDRAARDSELDAVIAGAIVVDPLLGIRKADIGIKDGRIVGVGCAGNPDITDGVDLEIGPNTWPIPCPGLIATPGAIDSHVHLLTPRLVPVALSAGVTTLITAGFEEPPSRMHRTLEAFEPFPINIGLQASARSEVAAQAEAVIEAGAVGLKVHEDWGAYPELIDAALRIADAHDVAVCLHTDGLNESTDLEGTVSAIDGRTIHAYHVEGAGGGHIPDVLALVGVDHVICSSTTPTIPFGPSAPAEHPDMIMIVHETNPALAEDLAAAVERVRDWTMAAEGPLHELGAIQLINSDSQGMGRIGETVRRTWQLADAMKAWRRSPDASGLPPAPAVRPEDHEDEGDNDRVLRYLAKITVDAARTHGISEEVGTLAPGRLADVVLWDPASFGVRPAAVIKAGVVAWGPRGAGNATVPLAQPTTLGPDWGATGAAPAALSVVFASRAAVEGGLARKLGTRRRVVAVRGTRGIRRADLVANRATAEIEVDPDRREVRLAGRVLRAALVERVPLSRRYLLA
jgi:urease subunit alpha